MHGVHLPGPESFDCSTSPNHHEESDLKCDVRIDEHLSIGGRIPEPIVFD